MFRDELREFMINQLGNMAHNVADKTADNIQNRRNNPFNLFEDNEAKYMAVGRSLDSQLGTRLQKIAFFIARYTYGFGRVPNIVVMREGRTGIVVETLSYPDRLGMTQCLYWGGYATDYLNVRCSKEYADFPNLFAYHVYRFPNFQSDEIRNMIGQRRIMPIDLFYLDYNGMAHSYEIKAGGNLDTKNKVENYNEVLRLEKVFSMFESSISKFATCYNNKGEGNVPDGAIFGMLDAGHVAIGRAFLEEVLPGEVPYNEFVALYQEAFEIARVKEIIINGN